ncbi:unnamed protein product [Enterobius vermicularis]|uniref:Pyridoxal phosphate homeostasis protein n=1 Tax=Enterobius vermicularis TaxID=51028 RepID=A0A0N4V581_ENTVE|nr:unnamed protein product [Enterobius vermicularis]
MAHEIPTAEECTTVASNLEAIMERIRRATDEAEKGPYFRDRRPELVAVSKTKHPLLVEVCYKAGQRVFGENYIQELEEKSSALANSCAEIQWHYIGQIQSNKIKKFSQIKNLSCVETLAKEAHALALNKEIEKAGRKLKVMVQVNTSNEEQKGGLSSSKALELAHLITESCHALEFRGFMTIGSFEVSIGEGLNEEFEKLFSVHHNIKESTLDLSMGMSHDFETAIKQGSTSVRVGSLIFGARNYGGI